MKKEIKCPLSGYLTKKKRALFINEELKKLYGNAECALEYERDGFRLLVMARLSAQCTDKRVNMVSKALFERIPTPEPMANCDIAELEAIVRPCGLYRVKAQNIRDMSKILAERGSIPDTMEELLKLPGVGRKIANLILGDLFGKPAIVADTHCIRISHRMGLTSKPDPLTTERELKELIPPGDGSDFCHRMVWFGREVCSAPSAKCEICPLAKAAEDKN